MGNFIRSLFDLDLENPICVEQEDLGGKKRGSPNTETSMCIFG